MNILQLLSTMGGIGGGVPATAGIQVPGTPGINPAAPPPGGLGRPQGVMGRIAGALFPSTVPGVAADPAAQRAAMLKLGLGMLAAGSKGQGFGEGVFNAYSGASSEFQGAMDRAYTNAERKRLEEKDDKRRAEDLDWRKTVYTTERQEEQNALEIRAEMQREENALREKLARIGAGDEQARAELARLKLKQEQELQTKLKPLEEKILAGKATPQEMQAYQLLIRGVYDAGPLGFGYGGGAGGAGGNPLLDDDRL